MLGEPMPGVEPMMVLSSETPAADPVRTVSIKVEKPPIPASVLSVASLLGLSAQDLDNTPLLEEMQTLSAFLLQEAGSDSLDVMKDVLQRYQAQLPTAPDAMGAIRQLAKFAQLSRQKQNIEMQLSSMQRQDATQETEKWRSFAKETGNWIPFMRAVERKNADAPSSDS